MSAVQPVLLAILDGWGIADPLETNAVHVAKTPNMDSWAAKYPFTTLVAHNGKVGLPEGQMGNSEVGHLNIGAGRTVYQDFTRINRDIETGDFYSNKVLVKTMEGVKEKGGALHLLGLVSDGGVHSHLEHLYALVRMAAEKGLNEVFVHAFMDGRDTPPKSGLEYVRQLNDFLAETGKGEIATIIGRYYVMDRDNRWDRVSIAWQALVDGKGHHDNDPVKAVQNAYDRGETDEFIKPVILTDESGKPRATISEGDTVLFFNFRADRVRELTHALTDEVFDNFEYEKRPSLAECVTFTSYDKHFDLPIVFQPVELRRILGEEISGQGLCQLRIAETEKYAHVTYFFNGGREEPYELEDRAMIPSPKEVATYDLKPEMSAFKVTEELLHRLKNREYSNVILNFANGDMVGHTGVLDAAIRACEVVDTCLGKIVEEFTARGGIVIITADHGNAEVMYDQKTDGPHTAHTLNPVPFILISDSHIGRTLRKDGALKDIAPTILSLQSIPIPDEMEGKSLIVEP